MNPAPDSHPADPSLCCQSMHLAGPVARAVFPLSCPVRWWARIATGYRLDGPVIDSRWGRGFPRPSNPPSLLYNGYRVSFPVGKAAGTSLTTHSLSSAEVKERVKLPLSPLWAFMAFSRSTFTLYLYSIVHYFWRKVTWSTILCR
jgi:hypothetical protein